MPTNTLVLPLLGGYVFIHLVHYLRFRSQRLDGYRLLLESGLAGFFLALLGRLLTYYIHPWQWLPFQFMDTNWDLIAPRIEFLGTGACSLMLGLSLPLVVNQLPWLKKDKARERAIGQYGNSLQRMLFQASVADKPVMLTVCHRKVYAGWIVDAPNLKSNESHLKIIPMFSGYRDRTTLELVPTLDYTPVYTDGEFNTEEFAVAIPLDDVRSCTIFNKDAFLQFLSQPTQTSHQPIRQKVRPSKR